MTKPFRHRRGDYTTCQTNKGGGKKIHRSTERREEEKRINKKDLSWLECLA